MLYKACFSRSAIGRGNMPDEYNFGDVLMVNTIRLQSRFRGYGIGLLALDRLVKHVAQASPEWKREGLIALDPSGLTHEMAHMNIHEKLQDKLIRYYELFGLKMLVQETSRHCTFVGLWMGFARPEIRTVVPHLLQ